MDDRTFRFKATYDSGEKLLPDTCATFEQAAKDAIILAPKGSDLLKIEKVITYAYAAELIAKKA